MQILIKFDQNPAIIVKKIASTTSIVRDVKNHADEFYSCLTGTLPFGQED